jgi:hypothetical protein
MLFAAFDRELAKTDELKKLADEREMSFQEL